MITKAAKEQITIVQSIVYETINAIYPNYYPKDVVNFFLNHHCEENILQDIEKNNVYLLSDNGYYFGTGSISENFMNRVYILKEYQGKGYGSQLMDFLEEQIFSKYNSIRLDSSFPAFKMYLKRGYIPLNYCEEIVENGCVLCDYTMIKTIHKPLEINILHRFDYELAECIKQWGWKYHHIGIPTDKVMPNERYLPHLKFYVSGFNTSPFGVEWMRFDKDCPISDIIKSVPHIAFEVDDIDKEFAKHNFAIISEPGIPSDGVRAAMILHNGAPIELIEFENKS